MLSIDILKWLSLFNASELSGAGREMSTLRVKSSQKRKFRSGCAKIVPNLRITPHKLFLDIWTPLLYTTREGGGISLVFTLALSRARTHRKHTEFSHWRATAQGPR